MAQHLTRSIDVLLECSVQTAVGAVKPTSLRKASQSTQVSVPAEMTSSSTSEETKPYSPVPHGSCHSGESSEGEETSQTILHNYAKIWETIPSAPSRSPHMQATTPLTHQAFHGSDAAPFTMQHDSHVIPLNLSECLLESSSPASLDQLLAKPRLVLKSLNG